MAAATSGGTSILTPVTATLPVGDLERVGVEDAAPVPFIQQMADMGSSIAAYLVAEEEDGVGHDTVYEARPLEP